MKSTRRAIEYQIYTRSVSTMEKPLYSKNILNGDNLEDITNKYICNNNGIKNLMQQLFAILTPIWKDKYVHRDIKPANIIIEQMEHL
jgi:serine/threonine protein kinase